MNVYYATILITFLFTSLAEQVNKSFTLTINKRKNLITFWLFATTFVVILVTGLRYYVGTDFGAYYKIFRALGTKFEGDLDYFEEPGIYYIAQFLKLFTEDGAVFIFISGAITIGMILGKSLQHTESYVFVSLLFLLTVWHGTFNGVRQYLAAAIVFFGHRYIIKREFWKYFGIVFIAYLFHSTAIVLIVLYFVMNNKITAKNIFLLVICAFIFLLNYETVFSFIGFIKNKEYDMTNPYATHEVNNLRVLANVAPAIFCIALYYKREKSSEETFYLNALIIHGVAMIATMNSALLARFSIYSGAFLPLAMGNLVNFKDKTTDFLAKVAIIGLFFIFWYIEAVGTDSLYYFHWIWER